MIEKQILALGFFDGVHLGHQALLRECRRLAAENQCLAGAVTFASHPDALVTGAAPGLINTLEDRVALLHQGGMDRVTVLPFDRAMMKMPWRAFFQGLLTNYGAAGLVWGYDFRFGDRGEGTGSHLARACREAGLPGCQVPAQRLEGTVVSSTHIRALLAAGDMEAAARFLGHPQVLSGPVTPGRGLGRTLGIPTANLPLPPELTAMPLGAYACLARVGDKIYPAVTNLGRRPTAGGGPLTVEAWLLDFSGDLYGQRLTLEFHRFLRPERTFPSLAALQAEIHQNAAQTKAYFENLGK